MQNRAEHIFWWGLALALLPWLILQTQVRIPSDAAWLIQAAEHFWAGQKLSEYYFDSNPPMCFLVYLPVVWIEKLTGLATWNALIAYTFTLNILSLGLSAYFLKFWQLHSLQRGLILTAFAFASTLYLLKGYGQKDHLIVIGLLPFCLAQLAITYHHAANRWLIRTTLILFIPLILIKPHYGLLPTALMLHRVWRERSLKAFFNADFVVLALGVVTYAAIIWIYFQDFIEIVLPLSLKIYVATEGVRHSYKILIFSLVLLSVATMITFISRNDREEKKLPFILCALAALALIPFWVQGKGFLLHYLPFLVLFITAFAAALSLPLTRILGNKKFSLFHWLWIAPALSALCLYALWPDESKRHSYYQNHPMTQMVLEDTDHKSFYLESNSTHMAMQIEEYTGYEFASRFSVHWFIPRKENLSEAEYEYYWQEMGNALAEDIERYKPGIIFLIDKENLQTIAPVFKDHPAFAKAMSGYELTGQYEAEAIFDDAEKIAGDNVMRYNIYRKAR